MSKNNQQVLELAYKFGGTVDNTDTNNAAEWKQLEKVEYRPGKGWYAISQTLSGWKATHLGRSVAEVRRNAAVWLIER